MSDSEDDDEDDEDRLREELKDLIDDAPIEEGSDAEDSDASGREKRKKSDDEDELDDRLEDDDYDLIEENLGRKVQRRVIIIDAAVLIIPLKQFCIVWILISIINRNVSNA